MDRGLIMNNEDILNRIDQIRRDQLESELKEHKCKDVPNHNRVYLTKKGWALSLHNCAHPVIPISYCPYCGKRLEDE